MPQKIEVCACDFHVHLREGQMLKDVAPLFNVCEYITAMTNLPYPVKDRQTRMAYFEEIRRANPCFEAIVAVMLTEDTDPEEINDLHGLGLKVVLKNIPPNVSTNSKFGVRLEEMIAKRYVLLRECELRGIPLSLHAELDFDPLTGKPIPDIKREARAIPYAELLVRIFPNLPIIVEHITTKPMVNFILRAPPNVVGTITAHHPVTGYFEVFDRKGKIIAPEKYCKPVAKSRGDIDAVNHAMISEEEKFFFGSDCAPHLWGNKIKGRPAAGVFCPPAVALPIITGIFDKRGALSRLNSFLSKNGKKFYGLPDLGKSVKLIKERWVVPELYHGIRVFKGGEALEWKIDGFQGLLPG